ncbi:multicopper oxidase family protein [Rhodopseudomonas sp. B29]|uniref:multicopper oxidase family protein n=1 Tax=Rhodopseudomonas sp. B29 TaxID=95607 RepID=UPI00034AE616|nr:multicopper oxidase domain-containing protein [Rhodopseudomonas sp. B29]
MAGKDFFDQFAMSRRELVVGAAGLVLGTSLRPAAAVAAAPAGGTKTLTIRAVPGRIRLKADGPELNRPTLTAPEAPALRRGDSITLRFDNALDRPALLNVRGLDGQPAAEPLVSRQPVPPGGSDSFTLELRSAGTLLVDARLIGDAGPAPMPALPLVVAEPEAPQVDGDQVLLIEDFRQAKDGTLLAPGTEPTDAPWLYTVNGQPSFDVPVRTNGRFRLRLINACQRNVIAVRIEDHDVRVMALDSQPAEPFVARGGAVVMAPGARVDVFVDATKPPGTTTAITLHDGGKPTTLGRLVYASGAPLRPVPLLPAQPLPGNGLPAQLPLGNALRVELTLGALTSGQLDWFGPTGFRPAAGPAFEAKRGRTVVLALTNRATMPVVFHLHGHHFRLLDRLDDGWKPFWLDTLALDAGQTQRIAFAAEHPGLWLMEAAAAKWSAPLLLRSYLVT